MQNKNASLLNGRMPMFGQLMTASQLESHGEALATFHKPSPRYQGARLIERLNQNEKLLRHAYYLVCETHAQSQSLTSAAEWLLDNYYLIEEQILTTRRHFPKKYGKELPCVSNGQFVDTPRVYDLVLEYISHVDGKIDETSLQRFVHGYQQKTRLTLGELWAIPIMMRMAIIENLRRVSSQVATACIDRNNAIFWVSRFTGLSVKERAKAAQLVVELSHSEPALTTAFVTEFRRRSQGQTHHSLLSFPLSWIEQRLHEQRSSIEDCLHQESQTQSAEQVAFSNSIGSLRSLSTTDWKVFVESVSTVESILREDAIYKKMDFWSRDSYRHAVEELARKAGRTEDEVAELVLKSARAHAPNQKQGHVGYYLIDKGRRDFETMLRGAPSFSGRVENLLRRHGVFFYLGVIAFFTVAIGAVALIPFRSLALTFSIPLGIFVLLAASQCSLGIVNLFAARSRSPKKLARLDYAHGVPESAKTLVVIPTILSSSESVDSLIKDLEIRFLGNRDDNIHFALLTDFTDAQKESLDIDFELLNQVSASIDSMNEKYDPVIKSKFFLFHRPRVWNDRENVWMGEERKRGKLEAFARFISHGDLSSFSLVRGNSNQIRGARYVITLDTDTSLPPGAAQKMISTLDHPLNRPVVENKSERVVDGYGILQPRVSTCMPSECDTWFSRIYSTDAGVDPYTRHVSNIYQDLFSEGSFIGKGIFDVNAFSKSIEGRFPKNRILSHDLIEGFYARCGFVSDVELFEEFPQKYFTDVSRRHRWIRGDWQIASWLFPATPEEKNRRNELSLLSRWKLFDNLRRSVIPLATFLLLVASCFISTSAIYSALGLVLLPYAITLVDSFVARLKVIPNGQVLTSILASTAKTCGQAILTVVFLPFEAYQSFDAIFRTFYRLLISRKKLLEWTSYSAAKAGSPVRLTQFLRAFGIAPLTAALFFVAHFYFDAPSLFVGTVLSLCWLVSPFVAWWMSRPIVAPNLELKAAEKSYIYRVSQKTWWFYTALETKNDNYLPPDNIQEVPEPRVAHRTSPTNMGIASLCSLAAYDLGFISTKRLIEREVLRFETFKKLERFQGHFLNWYDTQTLQPLFPKYISAVDSGNFVGFLYTFQQGLRELMDAPIISARFRIAQEAALDAVSEAVLEVSNVDKNLFQEFQNFRSDVKNKLAQPLQLSSVYSDLAVLEEILKRSLAVSSLTLESKTTLEQLFVQTSEFLKDLVQLAPWILSSKQGDQFQKIPTLRELESFSETAQLASKLSEELQSLICDIDDLCKADFGFLYDEKTRLFRIGYNVTEHRLDAGHYDFLASEARLLSYIAVAKGVVPMDHWFALGRQATRVGGSTTLISWSGSMFEYLMPNLVMPFYENSLVGVSLKGAVKAQIKFGKRKRIPWGISESGYNVTDAHQNYQYRAFGVPSLGLKRGLENDLVIAPYATMLSLIVCPKEAVSNLRTLSAEGFEGRFGFFEAIDFTRTRNNSTQPYSVIKSFMAHHEGMSLLAAAHRLTPSLMHRRFVDIPEFRAFDIMLQERRPEVVKESSPAVPQRSTVKEETEEQNGVRVLVDPQNIHPHVSVLSNGNYRLLVSTNGSTHSQFQNISLTPWRHDALRQCDGLFSFVKDCEKGGRIWSPQYMPLRPEQTKVVTSEYQIEFCSSQDDIECHQFFVISSEDDVELRRVQISNNSFRSREIEFITFAEVALCPNEDFMSHPAFSKLFVQTEILENENAILCTRRSRMEDASTGYLFHSICSEDANIKKITFETERLKFLGRARSLECAAAFEQDELCNTQGSVLDSCVAIRCKIVIPPEKMVTLNVYLGHARTEHEARHLVEKYSEFGSSRRVRELAWAQARVFRDQLGIYDHEIQVIEKFLDAVIFPRQALRAGHFSKVKSQSPQSELWGLGISGSLPIVLVHVSNEPKEAYFHLLFKVHATLRHKRVLFDLVILTEELSGYRHDFADAIRSMLYVSSEASFVDTNGGIHIKLASQVSQNQKILLQTTAAMVLNDFEHSLEVQLSKLKAVSSKQGARLVRPKRPPQAVPPSSGQFFNGIGAFQKDGSEYGTHISMKNLPPRPWVNVIANPWIGTVISERGSAYSWFSNAHEFRISPWFNDMIRDESSEMLYLKDEQTHEVWSPLPSLLEEEDSYFVSHGFGYSNFETECSEVQSEVTVSCASDAPVLFYRVKLSNLSSRARSLSVTRIVSLVLGEHRFGTAANILVRRDAKTGALYATNPYHVDFGNYHLFFSVVGNDLQSSFTADRRNFFGNGTAYRPDGLSTPKLDDSLESVDACAALKAGLVLSPKDSKEIVFVVAGARSFHEGQDCISRYGSIAAVHRSLNGTRNQWVGVTQQIQIETPMPTLDVVANGWLVYQNLACRMWARSGFYQSGGAYGFRDQLQDSIGLLHCAPHLTREHILRAAAKQFLQGDVLHWWHPDTERGVRTHFSDDLLWLPYAVSCYVESSGDYEILDERVSYLEAPLLNAEEESRYLTPSVSVVEEGIYEHCKRAIELALSRSGPQGLPLIGCGDWNDGMNKVGEHGKGESVWLAFFLGEVLHRFSKMAAIKGDDSFNLECQTQFQRLKEVVNSTAWDGNWYKRAFFDDGSPLGSQESVECQIDSLPQSWSVLSRMSEGSRGIESLHSVEKHLLESEEKFIRLFKPPFQKMKPNPGYIKGYIAGVRENGGQYTHATLWYLMALAEAGEVERSFELFSCVNPLEHTRNLEEVKVYGAEPYAVVADIYSNPSHFGRGGWSWYTGSASWAYRYIYETLFGIQLVGGNKLQVKPKLPQALLPSVLRYCFKDSVFLIKFENAESKEVEGLYSGSKKVAMQFLEIDLENKETSEYTCKVFTSDTDKRDALGSENFQH